MRLHRIFRSWWTFSVFVVFALIGLLGIPGADGQNRIIQEIWNLGHIILFALLGMFVTQLVPFCARLKPLTLLFVAGICGLVIGGIIEWLQSYIDRSVSVRDVMLGMLGISLVVIFLSPQRKDLQGVTRRFLQTCAVVLLLAALWPLTRLTVDEYMMQRQFPVLSDFTTPFEISRWSAQNSTCSIVRNGDSHELQVTFKPANYSTLVFDHFVSDWHGFDTLILEMTNPAAHSISLTLRIHDAVHETRGNAFNDRFNRQIMVAPGYQRITISLAEIENAPQDRKMDMTRLRDVMLFMYKPANVQVLNIHRLYLE